MKRDLGIDEILFVASDPGEEHRRALSAQMTGLPLRVEPRLMEQNFGKFESTPRDGKDFLRKKCRLSFSFGNGESMLRLCHRICNLLDELKEESGKTGRCTFWWPTMVLPGRCTPIFMI